MCGLLAIFTNEPSSDLASHARNMLLTMRHRGPDDTHLVSFARGILTSPDHPADTALGLNRLAIQDLSMAGRQPMCDPAGRYWIVFNGEIYNFLELRTDLQARGERFETGTDTEVLLRLLSMRGIEALASLDGMFAFVLFDTQERRVIAVRDRFGIKPLYYWRTPRGDLCFASEIKAFTTHPQWSPTLNRCRAFDFLTRGLIDHTSQTMFAGVEQIPGGHLATFQLDDLDSFKVSGWYELRPTAFAGSAADAARECRSLFDDSVRLRLRADVTVGSCLSGGIDSSSIVCSMSHERLKSSPTTNQKTFTARHSDPALDEWPYAREVAQVAQVEALEVHPDGAEMLDRLDELVWIQDEPFASSSIYAQYCVFRAARQQGVIVILDGQGADEQFAGYHAFFKVRLLELLRRGRLIRFFGELRNISKVHRYPKLRLIGQTLNALRPLRNLASRRMVSRLLNESAFGEHLPDPFHMMPCQRRGVCAFSIEQLQA
ncbi:MAG: asparagine synthase (glutamine-hydrolyzing), partial [Planctomycetes bacterium]|nr:asparagine synthase (glutamine-hydrolyzing) [Planctomycetota bacterium]